MSSPTAESITVEDAIRLTVQTTLGFTINRGFMDGTFDRDIGCVFVQTITERDNVDMAETEYRIRLWGSNKRGKGGRGRSPVAPLDNAFLEEWVEDVVRALEALLPAVPGEGWFGRPTGIVFDHPSRGVEITVVVLGPNPYRMNV